MDRFGAQLSVPLYAGHDPKTGRPRITPHLGGDGMRVVSGTRLPSPSPSSPHDIKRSLVICKLNFGITLHFCLEMFLLIQNWLYVNLFLIRTSCIWLTCPVGYCRRTDPNKSWYPAPDICLAFFPSLPHSLSSVVASRRNAQIVLIMRLPCTFLVSCIWSRRKCSFDLRSNLLVV